MSNISNINQQWLSGGVDAGYVGLYDDDGLFAGANGTLQRGEVSFMRRWQAIKNVAPEIPDQNRLTVTGDDREQGFLTFPATDSATVGIQVSNRRPDIENPMTGLNAYERTQMPILLVNPFIPTGSKRNIELLLHSQAKAAEYGVVKEDGWQNLDFWKGEITPGGPTGLEEQTGQAADFTMTLEQGSVYPDHVALANASEGTTQASGQIWGDKYRLIRGAVHGDGTLTEVNLPQTPIGTHLDLVNNPVEITKRTTAGVVTTLAPTTDFTVTTTPPRITFTSILLYDERYVISEKF